MAVLTCLALYGAVGLVFAVAFVTRGAAAMDPVARATAWHVRLLWLPGAMALWPLLIWKWRAVSRGTA